jgi:CRP-like cAMP-binding protein/Zn-dependent protease
MRGLWKRLANQVEIDELRPRLSDDIEIKEFHLRWGNDYAMIANPRDLIHYRLDPGELETVRLMDGTRTVKEIVVERFRDSGDLEFDGVVELVQQLRMGGFFDTRFVDAYDALRRQSVKSSVSTRFTAFIKTLQVEWRNADRPVRWLYDHGLRFFFRPWVVAISLVLGGAGLWAFFRMVGSGDYSLSGSSLALEFVILGSLNYFLTFTHELGHALASIHHGRRIKAAGFMIYYGSPAWFVDASDSLMSERKERIVQSAAGPVAELIIAGVASLTAFAFPDWFLSPTLYKFAVLNYFVTFMNLVPLLELDGYFIFSDLIQVPDLRPRSIAFIRYDVWHKIRNRERFTKQEVGLGLYAVLGMLFAVVSVYASLFFWRTVFGKLIQRMWEGGTLTRAFLVILVLLVAGPLVRALTQLMRSVWRRARAVARALRFRLEQGWRVEAAELIDALPLFDDVPVDALNDLAARVRLRNLARGQALFRQGERADAFYVVRSGTLEAVEENAETGDERLLRTYGRGESFGELGLIESRPRSATVKAAEEAQAFEVDKGTFDQLLADMASVPDFAPTLQAAAELRSLPSFQHLDSTQLSELVTHGSWVNLPPNEVVIREGDVGDDFFAIASGQVEVVKGKRRTATLGPGAYFGEVALLEDVPRTATVRTMTPVRAYRLDREGFDRVVKEAFGRGTLNPQVAQSRTGLH